MTDSYLGTLIEAIVAWDSAPSDLPTPGNYSEAHGEQETAPSVPVTLSELGTLSESTPSVLPTPRNYL